MIELVVLFSSLRLPELLLLVLLTSTLLFVNGMCPCMDDRATTGAERIFGSVAMVRTGDARCCCCC